MTPAELTLIRNYCKASWSNLDVRISPAHTRVWIGSTARDATVVLKEATEWAPFTESLSIDEAIATLARVQS